MIRKKRGEYFYDNQMGKEFANKIKSTKQKGKD